MQAEFLRLRARFIDENKARTALFPCLLPSPYYQRPTECQWPILSSS